LLPSSASAMSAENVSIEGDNQKMAISGSKWNNAFKNQQVRL
jgi:hypothetical protein